MKYSISSINLFDKELAIKWSDGCETVVLFSLLRSLCPCAFCSGEKDVFGTQYGGGPAAVSKEINIKNYSFVGHYGIQFVWSDGHRDGIYTFVFLRSL